MCFEARVRPDIVLGDFDSLDPATLERLRSDGASILAFPADKDQTDLEIAFDVARERRATTVTLTAASTGRLDHTLGALGRTGWRS